MEKAGGITEETSPTSLLQAAAHLGDVDRARTAISAGAELDAQDSWGLSPLHSATIVGSLDTVSLLLQSRAAIDDLSSKGQSALHLAAFEGREEVLLLLLEQRADAASTNRFGSTPLEIARRREVDTARAANTYPRARPMSASKIPPGRAECAISRELQRRVQTADQEEQELRRQLELAIASRQRLEAQLGTSATEALRVGSMAASSRASGTVPASAVVSSSASVSAEAEGAVAEDAQVSEGEAPVDEVVRSAGSKCSITDLPTIANAPPPKKPPPRSPVDNACEYWRSMTEAMKKARVSGEDAMKRSYMRDLPAREDLDPFPWTGQHQAEQCLALPDPDDPEFVAGYEWLQEVGDHRKMREAFNQLVFTSKEIGGLDAGKEQTDQAMQTHTGKTQAQWDTIVSELQENNSPWNWSSVEVRHNVHRCPALSRAGVYAVGSQKSSCEPVFREGDVVGPLSGVLRRLSKYENLYYQERKWLLHDPGCYILSSRVQTTELKLDALCIDLRAGQGHNRLCYLADTRPDPLGLRALLQMEPEAGPRSVLPPRSRMPRPRSRPGSPENRGPYGRMQETTLAPITPVAMQASLDEKGKGANVTRAEVLVHGYPYVFVVATRDILPGEELTLDYGEDYWGAQRALLTRFLEIGRLGLETVLRVNSRESDEEEKEKEPLDLPKRSQVRRVGEVA